MTAAEKIAAFDLIASCIINRWYDGTFSPWGDRLHTLPHRPTPEEALADLIEWAKTSKARVKMSEQPESIKPRQDVYKQDAWRTWSLDDLRKWVELLERRSWMRADTEEGQNAALKDRGDARAYRDMLAQRLKEVQ